MQRWGLPPLAAGVVRAIVGAYEACKLSRVYRCVPGVHHGVRKLFERVPQGRGCEPDAALH